MPSLKPHLSGLFAAAALAAAAPIPVAHAQDQDREPAPLPSFAGYPAEPYSGEGHFARICSEKDWKFRTRLRAAAEQPPDFAGRFNLDFWGCGTGCLMGAAVDTSSGEIFWVPGTLSCAWCGEMNTEPFDFRAGSRLLILRGQLHREGVNGEHFYVFENGAFVHLRTVPFD